MKTPRARFSLWRLMTVPGVAARRRSSSGCTNGRTSVERVDARLKAFRGVDDGHIRGARRGWAWCRRRMRSSRRCRRRRRVAKRPPGEPSGLSTRQNGRPLPAERERGRSAYSETKVRAFAKVKPVVPETRLSTRPRVAPVGNLPSAFAGLRTCLDTARPGS